MRNTPLHITLNLAKLDEYGNRLLEHPGQLWRLQTSELKGGHASARVYRHDLEFRLASGSLDTVSVVQKYTTASEVRIMRMLGEVSGAEAVPKVIDWASDNGVFGQEGENWFITPLCQGHPLTFEDEIPTPVIRSLARIHAHFVSRVDEVDWLHRVDGDALRGAFDNALAAIEGAHDRRPNPALATAYKELESASQDLTPQAVLAKLPFTLTHGDVHPWNIIRSSDGTSVLIDWGNARIAPPMLDLANLVEMDTENWMTYLSTWQMASGGALDPDLARLGYYWATVMVNLQYLPYVAGQWPDDAQAPVHAWEMVQRLRDAVQRMSE